MCFCYTVAWAILLRLLYIAIEEAPLLPKLQGNFAEFLGRDSLEHLRILSLTTCVGLRYGYLYNKRLEDFLGSLIRTISIQPKPPGTITVQHVLRI